MFAQPFGATNKPGTCLWCGRALPFWVAGEPDYGRGYCGKGHFCTVRCGWSFALDAARNGYRFTPR